MADNTYYVDGKDVTDICDAIRYKGGAEGTILWPDIPAAILSIPTGGSGDGLLEIDYLYSADVTEIIEAVVASVYELPLTPNAPVGHTDIDVRWGIGPEANYYEYTWIDEHGEEHIDRIQWWSGDKYGEADFVPGKYYRVLGCYFEGLIPDTRYPDRWKPEPAPYHYDEEIGIKYVNGANGYFELIRTNDYETSIKLTLGKGYFLKRHGWLAVGDGYTPWVGVYLGNYEHDEYDTYEFMKEGVAT